MTSERLTALLSGIGVVISKRQVVRLLTGRLDAFAAESSHPQRSFPDRHAWAAHLEALGVAALE